MVVCWRGSCFCGFGVFCCFCCLFGFEHLKKMWCFLFSFFYLIRNHLSHSLCTIVFMQVMSDVFGFQHITLKMVISLEYIIFRISNLNHKCVFLSSLRIFSQFSFNFSSIFFPGYVSPFHILLQDHVNMFPSEWVTPFSNSFQIPLPLVPRLRSNPANINN